MNFASLPERAGRLVVTGALVGLSRLDRDDTEHALGWPGAAAALAVVGVAASPMNRATW